MTIDGRTRVIAHVGDPTATFKASMIYNPHFESVGVNAAVVPMGVTAADFAQSFPAIMRMTNVEGALITMPHKVAVVPLLDEVSVAVKVAGSCNAVRRGPDGRLQGDMFDGEGFVRAVRSRGVAVAEAAVLVLGAGGAGSAIAAAFAAHGARRLGLHDPDRARLDGLAGRLARHYPHAAASPASPDPTGFDIVVNATPLGMSAGDPSPLDVRQITPGMLVGDAVMSAEQTPLLAAAAARGAATLPGIDMLFEQIPAYLDFFGLPGADADALRAVARVRY